MILVAVTIAAAALAVPHLLAQSEIPPRQAIVLWSAVLALRAVMALCLAGAILLLPATDAFAQITRWCFHAVIPFIADHLNISGHGLGDLALLGPIVLSTLSLVLAGLGIWRSARTVKRWLGRSVLGAGPRDSVIVAGPEVMVAAAGVLRPRVVVSAGALTQLDDAELAAGLEHERGHIVRGHGVIACSGRLLFAISRFLPGSRAALGALQFHLERDADHYAVLRTGDPLALASAICKAAMPRAAGPALAALSGASVPDRLESLIAAPAQRRRRSRLVAAALVPALVALSLALPFATSATADAAGGGTHAGGSPPAATCAL